MKKLVFLLLFSCLTAVSASSQAVYKEVMRLSEEGAADTSKDLDTRRIYQFKVDELNYMAMKARELMPDSSVYMLDKQAYAVYDYVNSFLRDLSQATKKDKGKVKEIYKAASLNNARYFDTDQDLILSYYRRDDYIIQFSLDTDWIKAKAEAQKAMEKLRR